jgi:hypothetical protein
VQEQTVLASAGEPEPGEVGVEVLNASGAAGPGREVGGTLGDLGLHRHRGRQRRPADGHHGDPLLPRPRGRRAGAGGGGAVGGQHAGPGATGCCSSCSGAGSTTCSAPPWRRPGHRGCTRSRAADTPVRVHPGFIRGL